MKRNQIMITALAIMIAIAGYLNFAGGKISEETLVVTDDAAGEEEMTALLDISEEDIASDIDSLDAEAVITQNYLDTGMAEGGILSDVQVDVSGNSEEGTENAVSTIAREGEDTAAAEEIAGTEEVAAAGGGEEMLSASAQEETVEGTPGEAVFTSTQAVSTLSGAKLLKEQTRAKNKETLMAIMNSSTLGEDQKQEAVNSMISLTDRGEREMEAEILLSAKGFEGAVVSMGEDTVDVVVAADALTDAQLAQIMDIVTRKTEIAAENVIISQVAGN